MPITAPAVVTRKVQVGMETVFGTPVAATKQLQSVLAVMAPKATVQSYRAPGYKHDAEGRITQDWSEGKLTGVPSYTEMIYLLTMLIKKGVTPTVVGTTTQKWVFAGSPNDVDTPGSATFELGGSVRAQQVGGSVLKGISVDLESSKTALSGDILALNMTDPFALTAGLSPVPSMEVVGDDVNVYVDSTAAGLGTTQQNGIIKASFSVANRFAPVWLLNRANASFDSLVEDAPTFKIMLTVPATAEGMTHLATLRSSDNTAFIRINCQGPLTEAGQNYLLNFDMCGYVSGTSDITDNEKVVATVWEYTCKYDPTWTKGYSITVQNLLATL